MRFHHLPESKRFPWTFTEVRVALERHLAVVETLFGAAPDVWIACSTYQDPRANSTRSGWALPRAEEWVEEESEYHAVPVVVMLDRWAASSDQVWDTLHQVIFEHASGVTIFTESDSVLYHPYDGGGDIIARDEDHLALLRKQFADWLAP